MKVDLTIALSIALVLGAAAFVGWCAAPDPMHQADLRPGRPALEAPAL
jgi:hypothetical protein